MFGAVCLTAVTCGTLYIQIKYDKASDSSFKVYQTPKIRNIQTCNAHDSDQDSYPDDYHVSGNPVV